ncbi:MAG: glycosyltransferase family 4 protein, partial [Nocardiopsaceae bacterium]|nr:glycosyltransferase family 4 protein [Nocardiopsaceae bacterium]
MRIVIVGPAFPYKGGGAHHTTELAHRLAGAGHEVVLESWKAQYPSFLYPGEQTISAPEGEPFPGTRRKLAWYRPDGWLRAGRGFRAADLVVFVVLSTVQAPSYLGMLAGLGRGRTRTLALCHNVLPHERKPYDEPLMRRLLRRVDGVLVHSASQAEAAKSLAGTPVTMAEMAPHFPERAAAGPGAETEPGVRRRLLFFGMVRPYKGLDVLLRALAAGPPDVSLTVAGEFWSDVAETRALIESLGLDGRVDLRPGYVPAADVPGLFAAADALVLPYRSATASQNVDLAFSHGIPAIVTRTGTLADQVRPGTDGLVCEPDDVASLTDAIKHFYDDPARYRAAVRPVDAGPRWAAYLTALVGRPIAEDAMLPDA